MYFFYFVNGFQDIQTLINLADSPSLLDNKIGIFFNFNSVHFDKLDTISDMCLRIFSLTFNLLR